jgi:hypothetical protein
MLAAGIGSLVLYSTMVLDLLGQRVFSNFYDLQARALLDGHFDVPPDSLGIEAFVVGGKHYLYFPPGPALLRMPILAVTHRFDGRLTTISMLVAWMVTVLLFSLLIWRVRGILRPGVALGRWEAATYGLLLIAGTVGSTVLFLGAIPWVYHEAYAWAIPMALGSAFALLGVIERPSTSGLVATGLFTTGAVLSRTTAGWAVAGAVLLTAVLLPRGGHRDADRHLWWKIYAAGLTPIAVGMAVNWAKFRHPYLFPIDQQVFTTLNQHRRDAIAANGGDLFSPNMIGSTAVNYFRPDGIRFTSIFPFISLPGRIPPSYGGGFIDQANRTGSIVDFMPLLVALTFWGAVTTYRPKGVTEAKLLRLPLLGVLAIPGGIMFYAYIAHRYTSEFIPLLLFGSAIGAVDLVRRLVVRPRRTRVLAFGALAVLVAFSVVATMAAAYNTRALANPGSVLEDYVTRQEEVSSAMGDPIAGYVSFDDHVSLDAAADELRIIDDCQALYIGTGDEFRPWEEVAVRPLHLRVTVEGPTTTVSAGLRLGSFSGHKHKVLILERTEGSGFRLVLRGDRTRAPTAYREVEVGDDFTVDVETGGSLAYQVIGADGLGFEVEKQTYDEDWRWLPQVFRPIELNEARMAAMGVSVEVLPSRPIPVCERLQEVAHRD